jgi:hypothetical protein
MRDRYGINRALRTVTTFHQAPPPLVRPDVIPAPRRELSVTAGHWRTESQRRPANLSSSATAAFLDTFDCLPETLDATRMASKSRWLLWARGILLSAICGHWIANWVLDRNEYEQAGLEYTWRASIPIIIQTVLVLLVVLMLRPLTARWSSAQISRAPVRTFRLSLLTWLVTSQLLLFLLLEVSERLVQREPFSEGLLASGFAFELLFAIGSALVVAALGSAALRVIRTPRREPTAAASEDCVGSIVESLAFSRPLIVVGDVRAPPLLSA